MTSLETLRALVDALPTPAFVHRLGRILHANGRFASALGRSSTSLVDRSIDEVLHTDDRAAFAERLVGLDPARAAAAIELRWVAENGTLLPLTTTSMVVLTPDEPVVIEIGADLAEQRATQARNALSDRLASVGTLAAGVAHEMNNPLTYVLANLEFMREQLRALKPTMQGPAWKELDDITSEAKDGADRVARIVRSLKVFSRVDEEKRVPLDVLAVVETSLRMADNEIRHRARLTKDYTPLPQVVADEAHLTQVFLNLFVNAAQAIPEGRADEHEILVKTKTERDGRASIEISDSGHGIAPALLPRVFDPFFTTKPQGVGTGLGLSICHGIVTALGGEILVSSTVGRGTAVRVLLPAARTRSEPPRRVDRHSSGRGRHGRVLVIDDDAAIGTAIRRMLGGRHEVATTTSGRDAVDRVARGERFDLILCDLMMPVMTGMEVFDALEAIEAEQSARIVFMTGGAFTANARAFLERVTNERVEKPFDALALRMLAKSMVDARGG